MNGITPRDAPPVLLLLVDKRVPALKVARVLEQRLILVFDDLAGNLLLNDSLAPVVIKPVVLHFFHVGVREEKRVLCAGDVEVNLEVDDVVV